MLLIIDNLALISLSLEHKQQLRLRAAFKSFAKFLTVFLKPLIFQKLTKLAIVIQKFCICSLMKNFGS